MTRSLLASPRPATHDNPTGRHCRQHALAEPGGLSAPLVGEAISAGTGAH